MASEIPAATLNISLPKPLKRYVDGKVSSGMYGSASEFVREAIREKLRREQAKTALTTALLEGLDSGAPILFKRDHFARKKRALRDQMIGKPKRS